MSSLSGTETKVASEAEFIRQAREKALMAKSRRKELQKEKEKDNVSFYKPLLKNLVDFVLADMKGKIMRAASRGFLKTNLFAYHNGDRFDGSSLSKERGSAVAFLINGPREVPDYWASLGVTPVFEQVREALRPFSAKMFFTGMKNGTVIEAIWDPKVVGQDVSDSADPSVCTDDEGVVDGLDGPELLRQAQAATKKSQSLHNDKETSSDDYYGDLLNKLTDLVLQDWKEKVDRASERGYLKTNLFAYHNGDRFDGTGLIQEGGSAVAFLLNGPQKSPTFWEDKGFTPVLQRVKEAVAPFRARMFYTGMKNGTVIEVIWDPELVDQTDDDGTDGARNEPSVTVSPTPDTEKVEKDTNSFNVLENDV